MDSITGTMTIGAPVASSGNMVMNSPGTMAITGPVTFGGLDGNGNALGYLIAHQGTINVTNGSLTNMSEIDLGDTPGYSATLAVSSGIVAVPWLNGNTYAIVGVGINGGTGVVNMTGNSLLDITANSTSESNQGQGNCISIGAGTDGSGHPSVGIVTVAGTSILRAGDGTGGYGGNFLTVGESGGGGTLTISGSGVVQADNFYLGSQEASNYFGSVNNNTSGGTGTLNLNGGTLSVPFVVNDQGTKGTINFNGGTLQALGSNYIYSNNGGTLTAYAQAGGAVIDTNGYSFYFETALLHDPALGATQDGGLTKLGNGLLHLYNTNAYTGALTASTYTGPTTVSAGTLEAQSAASLPGYNTPGLVTVAPGATLEVQAGGTVGWTGNQTSSLLANAHWGSGAAFCIETSMGNASYGSSLPLPSGMALTKLGYNNLILAAANTYTGATIVATGGLVAASTASLPGYRITARQTPSASPPAPSSECSWAMVRPVGATAKSPPC